MERDKLLKQFREEFELMRKELKLKSSFEDFEKIFFLNDFILKVGYTSKELSRMICSRIVDTYSSWNGYLHGLILPNPNSMISVTESHIFDEKDKEEITQLINKAMALLSINTLVGVTKDRALEARFLDDSVRFWNETFKPRLKEILRKVNKHWNEKA